MPLIGTLTSGVSALRSFTKGLEVIGNNIANVNTTAYKSNQASFADSFSNTLRSAAPSTATGSNQSATQVGTGVVLNGITTNFTQGSVSSTGSTTDLAISGNGYFIVQNPADGSLYATRAGEFRWDDQGYLVNQQGYRVQGLSGGSSSSAPSAGGSIRLKTSTEISAEWASLNATQIHDTSIAAQGATAASTALGTLVSDTSSAATAADVISAIQAARTAANTATTDAQTALALAADPTDQSLIDALALATAESDALDSAYTAALNAQGAGTPAEQLANVRESLNSSYTEATASLTSALDASTAATTPSKRSSFSFDESGNVIEFYANGTTVTTNQLLVKNFNDPSALMKEGNNMYSGFAAAGAVNGTALTANDKPNQGGLGKIQSGALELSNVDLTEEFANMITAQRSFQASSRLVTVSDTVLEDIVNLKR